MATAIIIGALVYAVVAAVVASIAAKTQRQHRASQNIALRH